MSSYLPDITDSASAKEVASYGVGAALFVTTTTTIVAVLSKYLGHPVLGIDIWALLDALLFGVAAWRIHRMSRSWAVVGLVLYLFEIGERLVHGRIQIGLSLIVMLGITLYFINGIRGVFAFHRYDKAIVSPSPSESASA